MNSTLILIQFVSQNIALFCGALVAGAATYVSLVEQPAIAQGGADLASGYLLFSQPRPVIFQASFGALGALCGIAAGMAGASVWWLVGGIALGFAALYQLLIAIPAIRRTLALDLIDKPADAPRLMSHLARLHAVHSMASLGALFLFIAAE